MKRIVVIILVVWLFSFSFTVTAQEKNEVYNNYYNSTGANELTEHIDSETVAILDELGIDLKDYSSFLELDSGSMWRVITSFFKQGLTKPLTSFSLSLAVILLCSMLSGMWTSKLQISETYSYVTILSLATVVLFPLVETANNCIASIKTVSGFMLAFVPVFGGILITAGRVSTGILYQSVMLGVCEFIGQTSAQLVAPLISIYICIGLSAAVSGIEGAQRIAVFIKSTANWILGFVMTFFTGFLSVQSVVGKSADNLTLKTSRFFVGSVVPVVGGALSEALTTVTAGIGLLRSSAMAWCIIVLAIMVVPIVIEMFLWKILLNLLSALSAMFYVAEATKLFEICSVAIGFLIGILLSVTVVFILSLVVINGI